MAMCWCRADLLRDHAAPATSLCPQKCKLGPIRNVLGMNATRDGRKVFGFGRFVNLAILDNSRKGQRILGSCAATALMFHCNHVVVSRILCFMPGLLAETGTITPS